LGVDSWEWLGVGSWALGVEFGLSDLRDSTVRINLKRRGARRTDRACFCTFNSVQTGHASCSWTSNRRHRALTSLVKADVAFGETDHASPSRVPLVGAARAAAPAFCTGKCSMPNAQWLMLTSTRVATFVIGIEYSALCIGNYRKCLVDSSFSRQMNSINSVSSMIC
jgi:hypothetical protein